MSRKGGDLPSRALEGRWQTVRTVVRKNGRRGQVRATYPICRRWPTPASRGYASRPAVHEPPLPERRSPRAGSRPAEKRPWKS
jgi:hypothetical protein